MEKTTQQKIEVMRAFEEGKRIECKSNGLDWKEWILPHEPAWDWAKCDYRVKEETPEKELKEKYYEIFKDEFQNDQIPFFGMKCSEWLNLKSSNAELKERLEKLVNAFNDYECAGPVQQQENTWEILSEMMHKEMELL